MDKKEINDYILTIVNFAIADANTYLYAKCVPTFNEDMKKSSLGGGNFTILLSTLATIEFLGTIYIYLENKSESFYSNNEIQKIKEAKSKIKVLYENNNFIQDFLLRPFNPEPMPGAIKVGSGKIIRQFLNKIRIKCGLNKKQVDKLVDVRNKLAHEFTPKIVPAVALPPMPGNNWVQLIANYKTRPIFIDKEDFGEVIDVNALNHKLYYFLEYVIEKFSENSDEEIIERISKYITIIK